MLPAHRTAWLHTFTKLALVLASAAALGAWLGQLWATLCIALLAAVLLQYWRLHRQTQRLLSRQRFSAGEGKDAWALLDQLLLRRQTELRSRKRRLLGMLRAYRTMADALPDAVVLVERNSQRVQWFNQAATPLLGLRYPQDQNAPIVRALQPLPIAQWLASGRNAAPLADVASPVDPQLRLHLRLLPYSEDLWLLLARDVSKLLHLEDVRRDFVANVSHELRTPLTVIHGYLEMLDSSEHPEWAALLNEMRNQSQRMAQLVEDLLTLSRLETRDSLPNEHVAMASLLVSLQREATMLSRGRHSITLEDRAQKDLLGAGKELHSAFSNLVSNAVRYTPEGGDVHIVLDNASDGGVLLSVRDTGPGIPEDQIPRLTERFYRVSASRSRDSGGTGLGLAIVKHVLGLHQARLRIDSRLGCGSTFSCHFQADRVLPRDPAPSAHESP